MVSDGHNLMLNSREEYRLWLLLKAFADGETTYFQAEYEPDMILRKWVHQFLDTLDEARKNPFETKEW